jgi:hypothetical protein
MPIRLGLPNIRGGEKQTWRKWFVQLTWSSCRTGGSAIIKNDACRIYVEFTRQHLAANKPSNRSLAL